MKVCDIQVGEVYAASSMKSYGFASLKDKLRCTRQVYVVQIGGWKRDFYAITPAKREIGGPWIAIAWHDTDTGEWKPWVIRPQEIIEPWATWKAGSGREVAYRERLERRMELAFYRVHKLIEPLKILPDANLSRLEDFEALEARLRAVEDNYDQIVSEVAEDTKPDDLLLDVTTTDHGYVLEYDLTEDTPGGRLQFTISAELLERLLDEIEGRDS